MPSAAYKIRDYGSYALTSLVGNEILEVYAIRKGFMPTSLVGNVGFGVIVGGENESDQALIL